MTLQTITPEPRVPPFKEVGHSKLEIAELVQVMNKLLANYSIHYQKLRNFHWNVQGPDFFDLHEKFEEQYNFAQQAIDDIAEKIRVFGQTPLSTLKDYLEVADIKESGTDLTGLEMVREVLKDQQTLLQHMNATLDYATYYNDRSTEYLIKEMVNQTEKYHWMWTAFSKQK